MTRQFPHPPRAGSRLGQPTAPVAAAPRGRRFPHIRPRTGVVAVLTAVGFVYALFPHSAPPQVNFPPPGGYRAAIQEQLYSSQSNVVDPRTGEVTVDVRFTNLDTTSVTEGATVQVLEFPEGKLLQDGTAVPSTGTPGSALTGATVTADGALQLGHLSPPTNSGATDPKNSEEAQITFKGKPGFVYTLRVVPATGSPEWKRNKSEIPTVGVDGGQAPTIPGPRSAVTSTTLPSSGQSLG